MLSEGFLGSARAIILEGAKKETLRKKMLDFCMTSVRIIGGELTYGENL